MKKDRKNIILLLLALSQFLVVLDSAIINVALPAIKEGLHFTTASLQWVVTSYILTFGGFLMLGGRAADLFGRRRILVAGVIGFTICSFLIGLSTSAEVLIVLRAAQGLAGAFMSPAALSILLTTFREGSERNRALSIWSVVASGGAAAGVFLGGLLTQYLGWRWNFFVNVPLGVITVIGLLRFVPEHRSTLDHKHLDIPGAVLITGSLMAIVYAFTQATQVGWGSPATISLIGLGLALLGAFIWNERRSKYPLVPFSIFKIRNVTGGNLVIFPVVAGALGLFFFSSLYIQNILQYSPVLTGLSFLPIPIIIGIISTWAPRLIDRFGFKPLMVGGMVLVAIGTFLLSLLPEHASYVWQLLPGFVLMAVGLGIAFVATSVAATSGVPENEAGLASGLLNTSQQVGGALGIAILSGIASAVTAGALAGGSNFVQASLRGYQQAFLWSSVMMVVALIVAITVIRTPKQT